MAPVKELMTEWTQEAASASHDCEDEDWGRALKLRKLRLQDFSAALEMIRPTAVDQAAYAAP